MVDVEMQGIISEVILHAMWIPIQIKDAISEGYYCCIPGRK